MSARILIVEDEDAIADAIRYRLANEGYHVDVLRDGETAAVADLGAVDLVLLDLMLPRLSGYEVCRRIRERSPVPILVLTARTSEADVVLGLEAGADEYVAKPFSMAELVARVRALLRRRAIDRAEGASTQEVGDLQLDLGDLSVRVADRRVELTPSEFRLLSLLATEPGRVFSRREIVEHLWRSPFTGRERTCDAHVKNLRQKLEDDPANPVRIVTARNLGYLLRV